jgi:class 3 adenylate cyclase
MADNENKPEQRPGGPNVPSGRNAAGSGIGGADLQSAKSTLPFTSRVTAVSEILRSISPLVARVDSEAKRDLESEIAEQKRIVAVLREQKAEYQAEYEKLQKIRDASHLLDRVHESAHPLLLKGGELRNQFEEGKTCKAFVMSIDIRRSTELMLKAREPKMFADFITGLCTGLSKIIIDNYGVFDKFTGDGVLAFFPEFFSGERAGCRVIDVADDAHIAFELHYKANRRVFNSILKDTGLGIGIDYGDVQLTRIGDALTVVGSPVVYACRLGGAKPGQTLLNQPAYEQVFDNYSGHCHFEETELDFKHEGRMLAYRVRRNEKTSDLTEPNWLKAIEEDNRSQPAETSKPQTSK